MVVLKILKMIILVYEKDEDLYTMFDLLTVFANRHLDWLKYYYSC